MSSKGGGKEGSACSMQPLLRGCNKNELWHEFDIEGPELVVEHIMHV